MSVSRHLVDPQIIEMLEMPSLDLTDESLAEIRANPMFTGELVPPPPFPVSEAFAPVADGPDVRLVIMNPPGERPDRGAILHIHGGGMVVGTADRAVADKPHLALAENCVVVSVDYTSRPKRRSLGRKRTTTRRCSGWRRTPLRSAPIRPESS